MKLKKTGKDIICGLLEAQVRRLVKRHGVRVIAVLGSVGKTSSKLAIANVLSVKRKVIYQDGNYNDRLTVPLVFFGEKEPSIYNVFAWARILLSNEMKLRRAYPYELAVLELGTDGPGQVGQFAYLKPFLSVVTAVAPEHMEYFKDIDSVAREELSALSFSERSLLNLDDIEPKFLPPGGYLGYGTGQESPYRLSERSLRGLDGQDLEISLPHGSRLNVQVSVSGKQGAMIALAATASADILGLSDQEIIEGLKKLKPVSGRMQILDGINGSRLIDDTYNSSPIAVKAALDVLYAQRPVKCIAVLGSMNELGDASAKEHEAVGRYCDPEKLAMVVTIGSEASRYLAPAAKEAGCQVKSFEDPYSAGEFLAGILNQDTIVLFKGSQNGVFAEEALKLVLNEPGDADKLVRQSAYWLRRKQKSYPHISAPQRR